MNNRGAARRDRPGVCRKHDRGFTLIEIVIVIALIALMAILATPWFLKISQRSQLKSNAYEVQSTLLAARMTAVRRNTNATVTISPAAGPQTVHTLSTSYAALPGPTPAPGPSVYLPKNQVGFTTLPPGNIITFKGDGTLSAPPFPTPGVIIVTGPPPTNPNQITIQTDPSGRVRVITPVVWN